MEPKIIGVREFHQNFKKVAMAAKRGTRFIVTAHRTPVFRIEPMEKREPKYTLKDLMDIRFHDPDRNLSKKIDEIVYDL